MTSTPASRLAAWAVHVYTAFGAVCALLALHAAFHGRVRATFLWLTVQIVIDSSDGALARLVRVKDVLPEIDGTRLDDIVDYLAYVLVPAALVVSQPIVPGPLGWATAAAMLLASALGFSNSAAKTDDHFFTGFPSYWNIVVFYLVAFGVRAAWSSVVLLALAALVFVPIRYVYPSRTPDLRRLTVTLGLVWAAVMLVALVTFPDSPPFVLYASLAYPVYYVGLSLVLEGRRRRAPGVRP